MNELHYANSSAGVDVRSNISQFNGSNGGTLSLGPSTIKDNVKVMIRVRPFNEKEKCKVFSV